MFAKFFRKNTSLKLELMENKVAILSATHSFKKMD